MASKNLNQRLYYSISEVAEITGLKAYVLRFWEKEFPNLRPKKSKAGNRIYQLKDIDLIKQIKDLLYQNGFTIEGAKAKLRNSKNDKPDHTELQNTRLKSLLIEIKKELESILKLLD